MLANGVDHFIFMRLYRRGYSKKQLSNMLDVIDSLSSHFFRCPVPYIKLGQVVTLASLSGVSIGTLLGDLLGPTEGYVGGWSSVTSDVDERIRGDKFKPFPSAFKYAIPPTEDEK